MRTHTDDNPHRGSDGRPTNLAKYLAHERAAATVEDALEFCRELAQLIADGKKGTFANLPNGALAEQARQIARKNGWCATGVSLGLRGQGWVLTDAGRAAVQKS